MYNFNIDEFVQFLLYKNTQNKQIEVVFTFLENAFDMFNFFLYVVIKCLLTMKGTDTLEITSVSLKDLDYVKDRLKYSGIKLIYKAIPTSHLMSRVVIRLKGDKDKVENYSLHIQSLNIDIILSFAV